jgi:hypothetical protein
MGTAKPGGTVIGPIAVQQPFARHRTVRAAGCNAHCAPSTARRLSQAAASRTIKVQEIEMTRKPMQHARWRRSARTTRQYLALAQALDRAGDPERAIASLHTALGLAPGFAEAHNLLGILLAATGDADAATASFRQAVAARPDYARAWNNLGNSLKAAGRLAEAEAALAEAVRVQPDYCSRTNLGVVAASRARARRSSVVGVAAARHEVPAELGDGRGGGAAAGRLTGGRRAAAAISSIRCIARTNATRSPRCWASAGCMTRRCGPMRRHAMLGAPPFSTGYHHAAAGLSRCRGDRPGPERFVAG